MASFGIPSLAWKLTHRGSMSSLTTWPNLNTDGFKDQGVNFGDIFYQMQERRGTATRSR